MQTTQAQTLPAVPARPRKGVRTTATVTAVRSLTPHTIRVTLGGEALAGADPTPFTDRYVKLVMAEPAESEGRPVLRTYTIRRVTADGWDIDVVTHGDEGYGGPWAQRVRPGDEVSFVGPGGDYAPSPDAPWHLLVGDESALPAVVAACEALPDGAVAYVFAEVADASEEQEIVSAADVHVTWVHRSAGASLVDVVQAAALPDGVPHTFLHGEAGCVRDLRRWARATLGVPRELLSASGYWRRGRDDEHWRAEKAEWRAAVEQDDLVLSAR
ncbi:siderophore-interacting protein [Promicromonospora thailandica]|uniref:NADPH-dependent ferric siderophore reductase, contains FAD-binding and SIP domains n=1 Tax=Promicromonospora thailandica TaxID=765201 RepID=A0A9X2G085_9MICO|nr:siderophore-interacting protein [Promicromonospora thailandica]MCP2262993.1 NADPH-dependent ferric siderophore reductase, contains FAD-binding and SIP domains [Promicromonospora thailandica]BFF18358.1 siderophore-interacting protein [Promicromonospora thailandica]